MDAAFRSAQAVWDAMLPTEHDDATDSELSEARDEFLSDTFATSMWLCDHLQQPELSTTSTRPFWGRGLDLDVTGATVDQLWVLILTGTNDACLAARHELRERMVDGSAAAIEARVPSIRASNLADARQYMAELQAEAA
jgi:hypothetical protein